MASNSAALNIKRTPNQIVTTYRKEMKYEFLKNLRIPRYSASVVVLPLMFYVLFGLFMGRQSIGNVSTAAYLIATYGTFGVLGASLFGTASSLASERGLGWLQVKRASPMPPFAYFVAKFFMGMMFSFIVVSLLLVLGEAFGGVRMGFHSMLQVVAILVAGSIPFCAMGLALGYFMGPEFRSRGNQSDLSSFVICFRFVGTHSIFAEAGQTNCSLSPSLPLGTVGAADYWNGR